MYNHNFQNCRNIQKYDTRAKEKLHMANINTYLKPMSTNYRGVRIWNDLDLG